MRVNTKIKRKKSKFRVQLEIVWVVGSLSRTYSAKCYKWKTGTGHHGVFGRAA